VMEAEHRRLRALLAGKDAGNFAERPNGKWSVIENLRHLLFTEFSRGGFQLSDLVAQRTVLCEGICVAESHSITKSAHDSGSLANLMPSIVALIMTISLPRLFIDLPW